MSDSTERLEARRKQKREWAKRDREARAERGELSYTAEWRRNNPEAYEAQKKAAKERRRLARESAKK